jgi:3-phosphoshikimate 1-carboxyvinyltransferase
MVAFPAVSEDSEALFRACRALGAQLQWCDEQKRSLRVNGVGRPHSQGAVTINVGNAGAVLRLLLGLGALLPEVTFITDHAQSLGKRPNRELLEALTSLGAVCEGTGSEGYLPVTIRGGKLHGGRVTISGARSSQYLSSLLFLAPLIGEPLDIVVVDNLKSQALVHVTLNVLEEAGIVVEYDETLRHFYIPAGQDYQPRQYVVPGDYPSAAALLAACAVATDPASEIRLSGLHPGERDGDVLLEALRAMDADIRIDGDTLKLRGGRRLRGIEMDGDGAIDCIPVLVAAACFAEGESVFYNIESLHYKESDRIDDLCAELRRAGCMVTPRQDAILVRGQPQGVEGGVIVDAHSDHSLLMALAIVALRSRHGLTLSGVEHIAKSYPHFFQDLQELGAEIS